MPGLGAGREEHQIQDKQKLVIKGSANNYQLIKGDIISVEPVPVEMKWSMSDEEFNKYRRAASKLMGSNKEFREESLRRFLKKNNILVYPLEDVVRLLKYKNKSQNPQFTSLIESERYKKMNKSFTFSQLGGLPLYEEDFRGFMPLRVVKRINLVLRKFPELYCLISNDNDSSCPEVFVVITFGKDSEVFVIDMWNKYDIP